MASPAPVDTLKFEDALAELETIVRALEGGKAPLDESISAYERGIALKTHCEKRLREAQMKIDRITISPDGAVSTEAFDVQN